MIELKASKIIALSSKLKKSGIKDKSTSTAKDKEKEKEKEKENETKIENEESLKEALNQNVMPKNG